MTTQVIMPQLGESVVEGTVSHWLLAEGQPVSQYDPLVQITTDKVDTEVTATASGILLKIYVAEGQTVERGTVLALIGQPDEVNGEAPAKRGEEGQDMLASSPEGGQPAALERAIPSAGGSDASQAQSESAAAPRPASDVPVATPVAQRMAQEHGVDLSAVKGSGPAGRITSEDLAAYLNEIAQSERPVAAQAPTDAGSGSRAGDAVRGGEAPASGAPTRNLGFISPAVARLAAEYQVDLTHVTGTGDAGRITRKDMQAYIAARQGTDRARAQAVPASADLPPWEQPGTGSLFKPTEEPLAGHDEAPAVTTAKAVRAQPAPAIPAAQVPAAVLASADADVRPLTNIRRSIAQHMVLSKHTSAHVTTVMEADMTRVVQAREQLRGDYERQGVKLTFTPFLVQAVVAGLKATPEANSSFNEDSLLIHRRMHIGLAVAIPDGLIVPVIRDADEKSLLGLARAVIDLAARARAKRLAPDEVQGGTFTLTNHGTAGSLFATPVINQPQAGILGVGAIQKRPVVISHEHSLLPGPDDYLAIRPMAYLSFTFDHRILDGAGADGFLAAVKHFLEHYRS